MLIRHMSNTSCTKFYFVHFQLMTPSGLVLQSCSRGFLSCRDYAPYHRAQPDDTTPLEHYIRRAEKLCFGEVISGSPLFSTSSQGYTLPVLQKGTWNRILVFAGCFSPPHLGHLELLAHIFLRTDKCTIAAMLIPCFNAPGGKDAAMVKGQELSLSKDQRSVFLQDKLMTRFS
jgi:hypothetical protein